jgi:hypothetical protein
VALSQLIPQLKVGILYTYFAPLCFVLTVTIIKEVHEDYQRYKRDKEANSQLYERLTVHGFETIPSLVTLLEYKEIKGFLRISSCYKRPIKVELALSEPISWTVKRIGSFE